MRSTPGRAQGPWTELRPGRLRLWPLLYAMVGSLARQDGLEGLHEASGTLSALWTRAMQNPELVHHLMSDVMWDQWVRVGGLAPNEAAGEATVDISTVQYLVDPGWADDLHRFQTIMDNLLVPSGVRPPA